VLGPTGRNFAAGMSGGLAYVWDPKGDFKTRCNLGMVEIFSVTDASDEKELKTLIEKHAAFTNSGVAKKILGDWKNFLPQFVKVYPTDYRKIVEEATKAKDSVVVVG